MKGRISFAAYMSRILFVLLYIADIAVLYSLTDDISRTIIGTLTISGILAVSMGISLFKLKVHSIKETPIADADHLQSCMDEVMNRSVYIGRKRRKVHLWIADNESLNCFTVGSNIAVNKSMLKLGDRAMLEGALSHELSHVYNYDSYFTALLKLNIFAGLCILGLALFGVSVVIVLLVMLLFGIIFSSWIGFAAGTIFGKTVKRCSQLVTRGYYYISRAFLAFFCRVQESEADRYAGLLGYSGAMISFLRLRDRMERYTVQKSRIEELLDDHPSNYRRTIRFERMADEIGRLEQVRSGYDIIPYENPFG